MKDDKKSLTPEQVKYGKWMREFYNHKARELYKDNYEYHRWFETPVKRRQYKFSTISMLYHLRNIDFTHCLEVGCGPGTWTKLLLKKYPNAKFTCLDISKEMIAQFKRQIKDKRVKTIVDNFVEHDFGKEKYDFVFSSRAIEYIPNKPQVIRKMHNVLAAGGKGLIVTSHPHPTVLTVKKMLGKKMNKQHMNRISAKDMYHLLKKTGFVNIRISPILFTDFFLVPTSYLFRTLYRKKWGLVSRLFATGYIVTFEKPR